MLLDSLRYAVLGGVFISTWIAKADALRRHLYDAPRKRRKQAPAAQTRAQGLTRLS